MVSQGPNGTIYHTKYYDHGDWLVDGKVALIVSAEHSKKVGITYGLQRAIGALGPSDFDANAKIIFWPANYTEEPINLKINSLISNYSQEVLLSEKTIKFEPLSEEKMDLGFIEISNFGTEIELILDYEVNGERKVKKIELIRLTQEAIKQINQRGRPDYPWFENHPE